MCVQWGLVYIKDFYCDVSYHNHLSFLCCQYLPEEQSPIEGFFVKFRPRDSMGPWKKYTILGSSVMKHVLHGLLPDTVYSIQLQSFNTAGVSPAGDIITKKTLGKFINTVKKLRPALSVQTTHASRLGRCKSPTEICIKTVEESSMTSEVLHETACRQIYR